MECFLLHVNPLLNQLKNHLIKNDKNKIIFSSLQVLRNTYKYSLEKTNIMSKNNYNLFFLWIYLTLNVQQTLFNYLFRWKMKLVRFRFKNLRFKKTTFYINHFFFFSQTWFLTLFSILFFSLKESKYSKLSIIKKKIKTSILKKKIYFYKVTKFFYSNLEINLLNSNSNILKNIFGISSNVTTFILKRFELNKTHNFNKNQVLFIYLFLIQFIPNIVSIKMIYLYNLLLLDKSMQYKTFRHYFNLPVNGQRTWSNGKSIKLTQSELYKYKFKKYNKISNNNNLLFLAEIVNILWKIQYNYEWRYSIQYFSKLPWYIQKKKKCIGVTSMANRRVDSFFKWKFVLAKKPKANRRKKLLNKNVLTSGFNVGFTLANKRNFI